VGQPPAHRCAWCGRRLAAAPPDLVELPSEPSAADALAERAFQFAQRAETVEVAELWFERASAPFARVPGGTIRQARVHEGAAGVWWEHGAELEDDQDEDLTRAVERATWHLAEAIRLLHAVGSTIDAELLEWDEMERAVQMVDCAEGSREWNSRLHGRVEGMLARGDIEQALGTLENVAHYIQELELEEEDAQGFCRGLSGLARRAGQAGVQRGEPWWEPRGSEIATRFAPFELSPA
jgi:hypothetical protein